MKLEINATNIFELAEDIERCARDFYKRAARITTDPKCRELFQTLAALEEVHEETFSGMRKEVPAPPKAPPTPDSQSDLVGAPTRLSAQVIKEEIVKAFRECGTTEQILRRAADFEKQTVALFKSLRDTLDRRGEQLRVDQIIREEVEHVLMLTTALGIPRPAEA